MKHVHQIYCSPRKIVQAFPRANEAETFIPEKRSRAFLGRFMRVDRLRTFQGLMKGNEGCKSYELLQKFLNVCGCPKFRVQCMLCQFEKENDEMNTSCHIVPVTSSLLLLVYSATDRRFFVDQTSAQEHSTQRR